MKKLIATLCALLLLCSAAAVFAEEVPSSDICRPAVSETLRSLLGGKSFNAQIDGMTFTGEDEDTKFTLTVTVCERDRFDEEAIDSLKVRDILIFGNGTAAMAMDVTRDEFGVTVKGVDDTYCFYKAEEGGYIAATETDYPFWTEIFTIRVPLEKDISFLDWSDPENLEGPVKRGFDELLDLLLEDTSFAPYNTKLTFDENGRLVEFLYNYSPWN